MKRTLFFPESSVEVDSNTGEVTFSKCEDPPKGVPLPWDINFDVQDVTYITRCDEDGPDLLVQAEEATLTWEYDGCYDTGDSRDVGVGRRLRKEAMARGNIKLRGRK
jgi:hypothetical protein